MVSKSNKIQLFKPARCLHCIDSIRVCFVPPWGIYVVVLSEIVEILDQAATKANLQKTLKLDQIHNTNIAYYIQTCAPISGYCWQLCIASTA